MNRIRKVLPAVVIAAGILVSVTGMAFAAYHISGTLGLGLPLIGGSTNNVRCDGQLTASSYLLNTGENVTLNLKDGGNPGDFVGRSSSHNRIAKYSYEGIFRYLIHTPNGDYISDKAVLSFSEPGDYKVTGYITFRWETDSGKVAAGFAKYYYRTFEVSCIIRVTDLEDAAEPEQPPSNGNQGSGNDGEEKIVPELSGEVSHTAEWEKHRQDFNRRCKELGKEQWYRNQNTYFSGEKFILSAAAVGENPPSSVRVKIQGTSYETGLHSCGGYWEGSLFEPSMIHQWGQKTPETLTFIFSAYIDGTYCEDRQSIVIDDRQPYWLMHRKE